MIRQTKPGLVALYDIRPGNGAGPFLQPRSPHGATVTDTDNLKYNSSSFIVLNMITFQRGI